MKYQFFSFTDTPTPFRLEPFLEEVFHEPEKYRKYFKPILAVDVSQIIPGETGELFFLYTTCGYHLNFEVKDGKYELVDYEDGDYHTVDDLLTVLNTTDIPLDDDEPIFDLTVKPPYPSKSSDRYVRLHTFESDLGPDDDDWGDAMNKFEDEMKAQGFEVPTRIGHLGGQPGWMQWMDEDTIDYVTGFVGQLTAFCWGDFYGSWIYMHVSNHKGRRIVTFEYQYT